MIICSFGWVLVNSYMLIWYIFLIPNIQRVLDRNWWSYAHLFSISITKWITVSCCVSLAIVTNFSLIRLLLSTVRWLPHLDSPFICIAPTTTYFPFKVRRKLVHCSFIQKSYAALSTMMNGHLHSCEPQTILRDRCVFTPVSYETSSRYFWL